MTDSKALIERLRSGRWLGETTGAKAADRIAELEADNARLREAVREVFEEWAGSEGFIPETAPEAYLLQLTKRMADIARAALQETSHDA